MCVDISPRNSGDMHSSVPVLDKCFWQMCMVQLDCMVDLSDGKTAYVAGQNDTGPFPGVQQLSLPSQAVHDTHIRHDSSDSEPFTAQHCDS